MKYLFFATEKLFGLRRRIGLAGNLFRLEFDFEWDWLVVESRI